MEYIRGHSMDGTLSAAEQEKPGDVQFDVEELGRNPHNPNFETQCPSNRLIFQGPGTPSSATQDGNLPVKPGNCKARTSFIIGNLGTAILSIDE